MARQGKPVLWHIPVSHFSEKVRWALDYKSVEHERKAPMPSLHMDIALALTRGRHKTFPVLQLDGETVGDSTAIIAALERRFPEPPLYPEDPAARSRALELEDFFDEELAPHIRLLAWHDLVADRERLERFAQQELPGPIARFGGIAAASTSAFLKLRYRVASDERAELGRRKVDQALDRLEAELGEGEYLAGDHFSVADLTAAALLYPLALPPEAPQVITDPPEAYQRFRARLSDRPGYRWVEEMFRRHRHAAPDPAPIAQGA